MINWADVGLDKKSTNNFVQSKVHEGLVNFLMDLEDNENQNHKYTEYIAFYSTSR